MPAIPTVTDDDDQPNNASGSSSPVNWQFLLWVPTLYFAMGVPFNVIMGGTAARMYKSLGVSDGAITLALGGMGIAWSLKPLWAAFLDMYRTKKFFVLLMEVLLGITFALVGVALHLPNYFTVTVYLLWAAAFMSSTQDICADGVYVTSLDRTAQARAAGLQGTFWVTGKIIATGLLISGVAWFATAGKWSDTTMWMVVMMAGAGIMFVLAGYHYFFLPTGEIKARPESTAAVFREFVESGRAFFDKRMFWGMIAFVFLYRLGEGLILMEGQLFLQGAKTAGGLAFSAAQVGEIDAVYGTGASLVGGLLGGAFASQLGLRRSLFILALALNIPHITFVILSQLGASGNGVDYFTVVTLVSIEKFGYGFGFVGNMIYMMQQLAPGKYKMTHYAFATSLMNLVLIPTNMASGPLAEWLGFQTFFVVVMFASVPSVLAAYFAAYPQDLVTKKGGYADDPELLTETEKKVQAIAGRAAMFAMLALLFVLVVDVFTVGQIESAAGAAAAASSGGAQSGSFVWALVAVLVVGVGVKLWLSLRAVLAARAAFAACGNERNAYRSNATGSLAVAAIVMVSSLGIVALGVHKAMNPAVAKPAAAAHH